MDSLFFGGKIFGHPASDALLVSAGRILKIGSLNECKTAVRGSYQKLNLEGSMLLPAFTDFHTHLIELIKSELMINLFGKSSAGEIKDCLLEYKKQLNWQPEWILGGGWDNEFLAANSLLAHRWLNEIWPDTPVAIFSADYHAKICNNKALQMGGITRNTPDPAGGSIQRDISGEPSGLLLEAATELLDASAILPPQSALKSTFAKLLPRLYAYGLLCFHTFENATARDTLLNLQNQGLKFRFVWHFQASELEAVLDGAIPLYPPTDIYHTGGLKLFADGTLGSNTAAMLGPDAAKNLRYTDQELFEMMQRAAKAGFGTSIHTIGSAAVRQAANTIKKLKEKPEYRGLVFRIEHLQAIEPADYQLIKAAGIVASMQPIHLADDIPLIESKYPHTTAEFYPFRSLCEHGIPLIFGSDAPIADINPFLGIFSATQRKPLLNPRAPVFMPEQALNLEEAVRAYSGEKSIKTGQRADLIVLEDFSESEAEYWLSARSLLTMMDGEILYENGF